MISYEQLKAIEAENFDLVAFRQEGGIQGTGKYKKHILVCAGTGCTSSGSQKIADEFEKIEVKMN